MSSSSNSPQIQSYYSQQKQSSTKRQLPSRQPRKFGASLIVLGIVVLWSIYSSTNFFSSLIAVYNDDNEHSSCNSETAASALPPIHVMFGLSGNHPGFLHEFQVALKSVLLHTPMERDLYIHVLADGIAYPTLDQVYNNTQLCSWRTRNPISLYSYDVSSHLPWLKEEIAKTFHNFDNETNAESLVWGATGVHTIGVFFRLLVNRIVPFDQGQVLYMDTDVIIMSNLEALWQEAESSPQALFHWGTSMTAGFVVMDLEQIGDIWTLVQNVSILDIQNISKRFEQQVNDQLLYRVVNVTHPKRVHILSAGWDMSATAKWRFKYQPYGEKSPNLGMLHYNGGGSSKEAYWDKGHALMNDFNDTWGQGWYMIQLPWTWARYQAQSVIRPHTKGYAMNLTSFDENSRSTNFCQKLHHHHHHQQQQQQEKERSRMKHFNLTNITATTSNSTTVTTPQQWSLRNRTHSNRTILPPLNATRAKNAALE